MIGEDRVASGRNVWSSSDAGLVAGTVGSAGNDLTSKEISPDLAPNATAWTLAAILCYQVDSTALSA